MALVGQVATVVQLMDVDAYGLITMIAEAARTVRRNRAACLQLARQVETIGSLLSQLHAVQAQLMQRPETRIPMEQLKETLRRAYLLVRSCQRRGYMFRCFMGTRHADELREVQGEITFYLQLFPLVSYVDTTLNSVRLLNNASDGSSCEEAPMVRPYFGPISVSLVGWMVLSKFFGERLQSSSGSGTAPSTIGSVLDPSTIEGGRVGSVSFPLGSSCSLSLSVYSALARNISSGFNSAETFASRCLEQSTVLLGLFAFVQASSLAYKR
ncbi:hypothetical protein ACP70R_038602 [Stipagrostis hirtigluma subsp. patula]